MWLGVRPVLRKQEAGRFSQAPGSLPHVFAMLHGLPRPWARIGQDRSGMWPPALQAPHRDLRHPLLSWQTSTAGMQDARRGATGWPTTRVTRGPALVEARARGASEPLEQPSLMQGEESTRQLCKAVGRGSSPGRSGPGSLLGGSGTEVFLTAVGVGVAPLLGGRAVPRAQWNHDVMGVFLPARSFLPLLLVAQMIITPW